MQTLYMGFTLPQIGVSTDYVNVLNSNYDILDNHDHVSDGQLLNQESILWSQLDMSGGSLLNCKLVSFQTTASEDEANEYPTKTLYFSDDLYYKDGVSNLIQLTSDGAVNLSESYDGFYGNFTTYNASVVFNNTDNTYTFASDGSPKIEFSDATCEEVSELCDLNVVNSLSIDSQNKLYSDSGFPSDTGESWTFFVNEDGNFRSCSVDRESTSNAFLDSNIPSSDYANYVNYINNQDTVGSSDVGYSLSTVDNFLVTINSSSIVWQYTKNATYVNNPRGIFSSAGKLPYDSQGASVTIYRALCVPYPEPFAWLDPSVYNTTTYPNTVWIQFKVDHIFTGGFAYIPEIIHYDYMIVSGSNQNSYTTTDGVTANGPLIGNRVFDFVSHTTVASTGMPSIVGICGLSAYTIRNGTEYYSTKDYYVQITLYIKTYFTT